MTAMAPPAMSERRRALMILTGLFAAGFVCVGFMVHIHAALVVGVVLGLAAAIPPLRSRYPDVARSLQLTRSRTSYIGVLEAARARLRP